MASEEGAGGGGGVGNIMSLRDCAPHIFAISSKMTHLMATLTFIPIRAVCAPLQIVHFKG